MNTILDLIKKLESQKRTTKKFVDLKPNNQFESLSSEEFLNQINYIASALIHLGHKKGDKIALFSSPFSRWMICSLAIQSIGCICVPIYSTASFENFKYFIEFTNTKTIFYSGQVCENFCKETQTMFNLIISLDNQSKIPDATLYTKLLSTGKKHLEKNSNLLDFDIYEDDIATIMFTSGSSSVPKGVELTHRNFVCQLEEIAKIISVRDVEMRYLNFLPLAHIFALLMNYAVLNADGTIYYLRDITQITTALQSVKPTLIILVPRLIQKIINSVLKKIEASSYLPRTLAKWAFDLADNGNHSLWQKMLKPLANLILYKKVRNIFGGKLRLAILGSSKSDPKQLNILINMGIAIIEGYGLTEACPVCANRPDAIKIGTIGKLMPGVEVKISSEGEILVRGNIVMKGYYALPDQTKEAIDEEGWLHTRDLGEIDDDGYIVFKSRIDDTAKTSYGVFIDSLKIESMLNQLPFVNYSVVVVKDKPFATCLIFPNEEEFRNLKKQLNLENILDEDLIKIDFMKKTIEKAINDINKKLDHHETIRGYRFIFDDDHVENLTPSMKIRRKVILKKHENLINEMYPDRVLEIFNK